MKLTALIPAHNDDYTLRFCLDSIVDVFDEIIVLDDCSDDGTPDLLIEYGARANVRVITNHSQAQLGWWRARNRLLAATDSQCVFFLDSDDVLAEYNASLLQRIAEGRHSFVRLKLFELWGDFDHGTGHRTKTDACHVFIDRSRCSAIWEPSNKYGGTSAGLRTDWKSRTVHDGGVLFFHIKGVKPDRRLYERQQIRPWIREGMPGRLAEWAHLDTVSPEIMHERVLAMLLKSKQDHIKKLYPGNGVPQRPKVIREAPARFEIVYEDGKAVDRIDKGEGSRDEG